MAVYDGASTSDTEIGKYCGSIAPENVTSSSNNILVTFISNAGIQSDGFSATFYLEGKHTVHAAVIFNFNLMHFVDTPRRPYNIHILCTCLVT